jgi:hypothetical protein
LPREVTRMRRGAGGGQVRAPWLLLLLLLLGCCGGGIWRPRGRIFAAADTDPSDRELETSAQSVQF